MQLLAVTAFFVATFSAYAKDCEVQLHDEVRAVISDNTLAVMVGGEMIDHFPLPVVGSFWRCIELVGFPDQQLVIVEWHEGSAGTSQIFSRRSLLAFSVDASRLVPKGNWVLVESLHGASGTNLLVEKYYKIEETDGRVDIVFTGKQRVSVNPD